MSILEQGAFQCLLSSAVVIKSDWQLMSLTESRFGSFCGRFKVFWRKMTEKLLYNIWHVFTYSFGHISDDHGIVNQDKSICICIA